MTTTETPVLISSLIEIPERVHAGDFVLKLNEGIDDDHAKRTLDDYVVTEQLKHSFDRALGMIADAVQGGDSKAAYLHGSFGSGKSHFMAVLHLLLQGNAAARSKPELAPIIQKYDAVLGGSRKFLLPSYHMIGAETLEAKILGEYARYVREHHPDAAYPKVFQSEAVFDVVDPMRASLGDDAFLAKLNEASGTSGADGWGELGGSWSIETYEAAKQAPPDDAQHRQLVSAVVGAFNLGKLASQSASGYVSIDEGLAAISSHAKDLGYDGVILFLDELILWLATLMGDQDRVMQEGSKIAKLVEAGAYARPVPIISFIARQRDLRDLVGEDVPGAERMNFADIISWWEGRFETITLEDRNLPDIAERRLLRPVSDDAAVQKKQAFDVAMRTVKGDVMFGKDGDRDLFSKVYPFSPALIDTLVAVSSALQRERTALKVMLLMLVERRSDLQVGDFIPVGDLFDVIAEGDEPLTEDMRRALEQAKQLYSSKLRPMLLKEHGLRSTDEADEAVHRAFRADDRLIKTLLLAALVPGAESLKNLTIERLVELNHGQIKSRVAGQEYAAALGKLRKYAAAVGELRIGDDPRNPTIHVQLLGVDTDAILERVAGNDNMGARRRLLQSKLFELMGISEPTQGELVQKYALTWRGTTRRIEVRVGNVRDKQRMPDASFHPTEEEALLVIDFPFDDEGYTPNDDKARVEELRQAGVSVASICWLPNFFTPELERDIGALVRCEYVLSPQHFENYTTHLSAVHREQAKGLLENQRAQLDARVRDAIEQAYGAKTPSADMIVPGLAASEQLASLDPGLELQPVKGPHLKSALDEICSQLFSSKYPAHPEFGGQIQARDVERVQDALIDGLATGEPSFEVLDKSARPLLKSIAQPLQLGEMHDTRFVVGTFWKETFDQKIALAEQERSGEPITVADLRTWMDEPRPRGLDTMFVNLILRVYAEQTKRSFRLHGGPFSPEIRKAVPGDVELRAVELPEVDHFDKSVKHAASLFGIHVNSFLTVANVEALATQVKDAAQHRREHAASLVAALGRPLGIVGVSPDDSDRWRTAAAASELFGAVANASDNKVIELLAGFEAPTSLEAVGRSGNDAQLMVDALRRADWDVIETALQRTDDDVVRSIKAELTTLLARDEFAQSLVDELPKAYGKITAWLASQGGKAPTSTPTTPTAKPGTHHVEGGRRDQLKAVEAAELLDDIKKKMSEGGTRYLTIEWHLDEEDAAT